MSHYMARDINAILDKVQIIEEDLKLDWSYFLESQGHLRRAALNFWSSLAKSLSASKKEGAFSVGRPKDIEDAVNKYDELVAGVKKHDPLPAYYYKEDKHFKKKYTKLLSHIDKVLKNIRRGKKSTLIDVQSDLDTFINEINILRKDDSKFFEEIQRMIRNDKFRKKDIKEFLGDEFKTFWRDAKPYFESHIKSNTMLFTEKRFAQGVEQSREIIRTIKARKQIYEKFLDAAQKLKAIARDEVRHVA